MVEIRKTQPELLLESFNKEFDAFKLKMQHLKFRRLSEQEALQIIFDKKLLIQIVPMLEMYFKISLYMFPKLDTSFGFTQELLIMHFQKKVLHGCWY